MMGALHSFPPARPAAYPAELASPEPQKNAFGVHESRRLLSMAHVVYERAVEIIEWLDGDRERFEEAGVEGMAIELSSILEGNRLEGVLDELRNAARAKRPAEVSDDGLRTLRRAEKLVAEIRKALGIGMVSERRLGLGFVGDRRALGAPREGGSLGESPWLIAAVLGIAAIALILLARR